MFVLPAVTIAGVLLNVMLPSVIITAFLLLLLILLTVQMAAKGTHLWRQESEALRLKQPQLLQDEQQSEMDETESDAQRSSWGYRLLADSPAGP